jgi:hypothetical protein
MAFAWTHGPTAFFDHGLMFCATRERARLAAAGRHARLAIQQEEARLRRLFPPLPAALVAGVFRQYTLRVMLYDIRNQFALATVSGSVFRIVVRNAWRSFPADFEIETPAPVSTQVPSVLSLRHTKRTRRGSSRRRMIDALVVWGEKPHVYSHVPAIPCR